MEKETINSRRRKKDKPAKVNDSCQVQWGWRQKKEQMEKIEEKNRMEKQSINQYVPGDLAEVDTRRQRIKSTVQSTGLVQVLEIFTDIQAPFYDAFVPCKKLVHHKAFSWHLFPPQTSIKQLRVGVDVATSAAVDDISNKWRKSFFNPASVSRISLFNGGQPVDNIRKWG